MYEQRITSITVAPAGDGTYSDDATRIDLIDEGAGEFVSVEQDSGSVRIDPEEWPAIREAIDRMIAEARG